MVRKERLELSHPKILEPKSSASTNSATPASSIQVILFWNLSTGLIQDNCQFRNYRTQGSYFKLFIEQQKINGG